MRSEFVTAFAAVLLDNVNGYPLNHILMYCNSEFIELVLSNKLKTVNSSLWLTFFPRLLNQAIRRCPLVSVMMVL